MSRLVQRVQNGATPSFGLRLSFATTLPTTLPGSYARWPSVLISAGSSVTAPRMATNTTMIAPNAIECIVLESIRNRPASAMITVTPENATARPRPRPERRPRGARAGGPRRPHRARARLVLRGALGDLLLVSGEDEQRVVD